MQKKDLTAVETHFAFGENWSDYAKGIDEKRIDEAKKGLLRLLTQDDLQDATFLDIGCGSGLHSLAALKLGARSVVATDIDPASVATTKSVLDTFASGTAYTVREESVFDLSVEELGTFSIVYSWGVLHHTGDMYRAITNASLFVSPGGVVLLALYGKTPMCGVWRTIKRWYAHTSPSAQRRARNWYTFLMRVRFSLSGRDFAKYQQEYFTSRGMSFEHDVHDWLGGYPYESISPQEIETHMKTLGFTLRGSKVHNRGLAFFGSGCDEYVFTKDN